MFDNAKNTDTHFFSRLTKMKTKAFVSLQLPPDLKSALTAKAEAEEINVSQLCRRILKQHIAQNPPPVVTQTATSTEHPGHPAAA